MEKWTGSYHGCVSYLNFTYYAVRQVRFYLGKLRRESEVVAKHERNSILSACFDYFFTFCWISSQGFFQEYVFACFGCQLSAFRMQVSWQRNYHAINLRVLEQFVICSIGFLYAEAFCVTASFWRNIAGYDRRYGFRF